MEPFETEKYIYLIFDSVHIIKNIRNNLLTTSFFHIPALDVSLMDVSITSGPGIIRWSIFHRIHEHDLSIECHMRKAPKITYQSLHPGNNKQSVPLTLAIFDLTTTTTAIRQYFPEEITTSSFLSLIYNWWLVVNAKERFHPNIVGNALIAGDGKIEFLRQFSDWLSAWRDSEKHGLSKQTFNALISTNRAIADLSSDLLNEGYNFVLTGRLQTDPLERRFSQYRQMSGGRFLVSLKQVYRSESIIKVKTLLANNIELTTITSSLLTDEQSIAVENFVQSIVQEDLDDISISQDAIEVITFIPGYISRSLLKKIDFVKIVKKPSTVILYPVRILTNKTKAVSSCQHHRLITTHSVHFQCSITLNKEFSS